MQVHLVCTWIIINEAHKQRVAVTVVLECAHEHFSSGSSTDHQDPAGGWCTVELVAGDDA